MSNSTFLKNSVLTFTRNILVILLGLFTTVLIARILGPEKQGIYTLVILLPTMLMTFLDLGIGSATVYYTGKGKYPLQTILSTNIIFSIFLSVLSIGTGCIIIYFFSESIFSEVPITLLFIFLSVLPVLFFNNLIQYFFQGIEDFKSYNAVAIFGKVINLVSLVVTIYLLSFDLIGALFSFSLGHIITTLLIINLIKKQGYKLSLKSFSIKFTSDSLVYGFKAHLSNVVAFINYRADILIISYFLNPASVGIYNVAINIAERLWIISQPISAVLFPRISSSGETAKNNLTAVVTRNVLFLSIVASIAFFFLANLFVNLLFGNDYIEAATVIKILLPGITVFAAERILSNSLAGRGKPELNLYTSLVTVISNIILNILLIPRYGLIGGAIATSTSYIITFIIKLNIYLRVTNGSLKSLIILTKSDLMMYKNTFKKLIRKL